MSAAAGLDRRARDGEARRRARSEFAWPLLLEAGAGTGKTSVLVTRVLAWCLAGGWERAAAALAARGEEPEPEAIAARALDRVVAITFTEAAAAEMEERIAKGLQALAAEAAPLPAGLDADAVPADAALRRARARALLTAFDRLRVSTIHAFCRRLLAEHPQEAGVHPRFTVDAAGLARAAAAREAVEEWLFDAARADDPDVLALVEEGVAAPELEATLEAMLAAAIPPERFAEDPLAAPRIAAFLERLRAAVEAFASAGAERLQAIRGRNKGREVAEAAAASLPLLAATPRDGGALGVLVRALAALWDEKRIGRLADFAKGKLGVAERAALAGAAEDFCAAARALEPVLRHALTVDPPHLARVHRVLAALHERAAGRMHGSGAVSFDALLRRAHDLLERHPDVTARERARIDQLLVDEFQDTDAAQCALVARLALDAEGGPRPGLFVVGDPKQSIYGWRNADLAAYEAFRARLVAAGGEVHPLCVNYRSTPAVLDEVERAMRGVMVAAPGAQPPFEPLLAGRETDGPAPPVEYWIASDWEELADGGQRTGQRAASQREAVRLAQDLLRLAREARERGADFEWKDVGILLRSTSDLELVLSALREAGVPYTVARDRQYASRREVVEARALVRAVLDPGDQIALVAALRAGWAGVPDAAWRPLWRHGFPDAARALLDGRPQARATLARAVGGAAAAVARDAASVPGLAEFAGWDQALLHAMEVLAALRRSFACEPAERFVERLRTLPLLPAGEAARFLGPWRLANLERFFRELGESLEESAGDAAAVLRALRREDERDAEWDEGRPARPGDDAVQVMTIHAAKGLQFEHVYLLQVHKGEGGGRPAPFAAGAGALAGEWCLGVAGVATLGFDEVRAARQRIERHERVRTLYVALTRARRRLVVSGHWSQEATHGVHGGLLAASRGPALAAAVAQGEAAGEGWDGALLHDGARWLFLARAPDPGEAPLRAGGEGALDEARVRAEAERLAALRGAAVRRAGRALAAAVTGDAPSARREVEAERAEAEERARRRAPPAADREVAAAVGTAIHALLERMDWQAPAAAEWEAQRSRLRAALARAGLAPAQLAGALARAESLVERVRAGRLAERLRALAPHVVARELPVLLRPVEDVEGPVGAGVGAIDLVVKDPAHGWTVIDFKTDRVRSGTALAERVAHHRAQGLAYRRALAEALALEVPPRLELWFLDADEAAVLD